MKRLRYCNHCKIYTLKEKCPICNRDTIEFRTLKYSPEDKWQKYRIIERFNQKNSENKEKE